LSHTIPIRWGGPSLPCRLQLAASFLHMRGGGSGSDSDSDRPRWRKTARGRRSPEGGAWPRRHLPTAGHDEVPHGGEVANVHVPPPPPCGSKARPPCGCRKAPGTCAVVAVQRAVRRGRQISVDGWIRAHACPPVSTTAARADSS
jgi:hypothetical protein